MAQVLSYREHIRRLNLLGIPLVLSNLAQMAISTTDTIMMGWYDVVGLAAVSLMSSFSFVLFIVGSGFAMAVSPLVAAAAEQGDETQIRRVTRMAIWLSGAYFLCILPIMYWSEPILLALGQEEEVALIAQNYARINMWSILAALLVMVLKSYLSALERAGVVLWATLAAVVVNALVNYAFIFGNWGMPELGARGAALASVGAAVMSCVVLVIYALSRFPQHALFQRVWRPDMTVFHHVYQMGWPIGLTNLAESGLFAASGLMMGWLGTVALASHGIALQITALTFMVHLGLSNAATVRVGRAHGNRNYADMRRGAVVAVGMSLAFAISTVAAFLLIPDILISAFLDSEDPYRDQIIVLGSQFLAVAALFQLADGAQAMALGFLRGMQDTRIPMIMAACSYWLIGVPTGYVLAFVLELGGTGLWFGLAIGLACAGTSLHWRFWTQTKVETSLA